MAKMFIVTETGGPEVMKLVDRDAPEPGPGQIRIRQTAMGVNFIDVHYRRGTSPVLLPFTPGLEGVGFVEEVGPGVAEFRPGDRIAYASASITTGGYAEVRLFPAERAFKLPDSITDVDAAALLYRGITVHGLIRSCFPLKAGQVVLLHAAAGGIGSVLSEWAKHLGATIIGTVSNVVKAKHALACGCRHVIVNDQEDFVARVLELTDGRGVDVVYDSVGRNTFLRSLSCIRRYGTMVSFGQTSGAIEPFDPSLLQVNGLYLTKFSGSTYGRDVSEYQTRAREVLDAITSGIIVRGNQTVYPLADAARAHRDLESRNTTGSLVLRP